MICHDFKKSGGGKGRPGRATKCVNCGINWETHGSGIKRPLSIPKKRIKIEAAVVIAPMSISLNIPTSAPTIILPVIEEIKEIISPTSIKSKLDSLFEIAGKLLIKSF